MKKISLFLSLIILVVVAYLVATYLQGEKARQAVDQKNSDINQLFSSFKKNLGNVSLKQEDSSVSLLSRQSQITLINSNSSKPSPLQFEEKLEYGPLPISEMLQGSFRPVKYLRILTLSDTPEMRTLLQQTNPNKAFEPPFKLRYTVDYNDTVRGKFFLNSIDLNNATNLSPSSKDRLIMAQSEIDFAFDKSMNNWSSSSSIPSIELHFFPTDEPSEQVIMKMEDLHGSFNYTGSEDTPLEAKGSSHLKSLSFNVNSTENTPQILSFRLSDFAQTMNLTEDKQLIGFMNLYRVGPLQINEVNLGSISYQLNLDRLEAASTRNLLNTLFSEGKSAILAKIQNPELSDERILYPLGMKIGLYALSALSKTPQISYGPISHTNQGGRLSLKASAAANWTQLTSNWTQLNSDASSTETPLVTAVHSFAIEVSGSEQWLAQLITDIATVSARFHQKPELSPEERHSINQFAHQVAEALVKSEFVTRQGDTLSLSLSASAGENMNLTLTLDDMVTLNGVKIPLLNLEEQFGKISERLEIELESPEVELHREALHEIFDRIDP